MNDELQKLGQQAKQATRHLVRRTSEDRNNALRFVAQALREKEADILAANAKDIQTGQEMGLGEALIDRLRITPDRLDGIINDVLRVTQLPDPLGGDFESRVLPNGLRLSKRRIPIGVIGLIYESRPNVTVDIATLCIKSGNAAIMRGGKEAIHTNRIFAEAVVAGAVKAGLPEHSIQLVQSTDRSMVKAMMQANDYIDMIIPRGGASLHQFAIENATIPVITGGMGVCHVYADASADPEKLVPIVVNAKVQRPSVCNAMDTLLIHSDVAGEYLPRVASALGEYSVEMRCDPRAYDILKDVPNVKQAGPDDFSTEFMALIAAIKVVDNLDEALDHIHAHSTKHTEAIVTEDYQNAHRFVDELDSSAVMVNASTRFNDGGQFGLGAEVAISTQRLHARGPMGLQELTTYKWVVLGTGQIRA